jgi:hypothetical protein
MECCGKSRERALTRRCRLSRIEDQLWAVAYEEVWSVVRRLTCRRGAQPLRGGRLAIPSTIIARRA